MPLNDGTEFPANIDGPLNLPKVPANCNDETAMVTNNQTDAIIALEVLVTALAAQNDIYVDSAAYDPTTDLVTFNDTDPGTPAIVINLSPIRSTFMDNGNGSFTHTSGTGAGTTISVCDLLDDGSCTLFTVNSGSTPTTGDDVFGTADIEAGETLHFWSTTAQINVTEGSARTQIESSQVGIGPPTGATPARPVFYFDTLGSELYYHNGANWEIVDDAPIVQAGNGVPDGTTPLSPDIYVDRMNGNIHIWDGTAWFLASHNPNQVTTGNTAPTGATPTANPYYVDQSTAPHTLYYYTDANGWNKIGDAANVQADWNQTNITNPAYILNKPTTITAAQAAAIVLNTAKVSASLSIDTHNDVDTTTTAPVVGQALVWNGTNFVPVTINGTTNLGTANVTATNLDVTSSSGANTTLPFATNTNAGVMTAAQSTKLAGIEALAEVNVQSDWTETDTTEDSFILNKPTTITAAQSTKLAGIEALAEVNVQSDWNETDTTDDAFILNKPTTISAAQAAAILLNTAKVSASLSIDTHSDVDTTTTAPTAGQVLAWNGTNWVPTAAGGFTCANLNSCSVDSLSDVDTSTTAPTAGQVLAWNGTNFVPTTGGGGGTATNLGVDTITATTIDVTSSDGTDTTLPAATPTTAGVMTAEHVNDIDDLITLSGVAENEEDLATFTGVIIDDDQTIKAALQDLEDNMVLNNYETATDPTVNDDAADGYEIGSEWTNSATGETFKLVDSTNGAAVWEVQGCCGPTICPGGPTTVTANPVLITNGSFESGDFTSWTVNNATSAVVNAGTSQTGRAATQGTSFAEIRADGSEATGNALIGTDINTLLGTNYSEVGVLISDSFTLGATKDIICFDVAMENRDIGAEFFNDSVYVVWIPASGPAIAQRFFEAAKLNLGDPDFAGFSFPYETSVWKSGAFSVGAGATGQLALVVGNEGDPGLDSIGMIDNVKQAEGQPVNNPFCVDNTTIPHTMYYHDGAGWNPLG